MDENTGENAPIPEESGAVEIKAENLSGNDLVARLLEKRTGQAEPAEEEPPPAEQPAETEETEAPPEIEEQPEGQPKSETLIDDGTDVLSKYGINLDEMPPNEAEQLAKQLGSRAVKRFGRLTGQKKELQERLDALEARYEQTLAEKQEGQEKLAQTGNDHPLLNISTIDKLEEHTAELNDLIDWVGDQLHNEVQYDDEGEEYLAELNGQKYGRQELQTIRANARKAIRKDVPKRKEWIQQRQEFDTVASNAFDWLDNQEDPKTQFFHQIKSNPEYQGFVDTTAAGNFAAGLMAIGWEVFNSKAQASQKQEKKQGTPASKPPPAATPQAAPPKQVQGRQTDLQRQIQAAEQRFNQTGNSNDLVALRKLKAMARGA